MSDELEHRIARLEDSNKRLETADDNMQKTLQQLVVSSTLTNELLTQFKELIPVVHQLQIDMSNNKLIIKGVQWLAGTVGAVAVMLIINYLFMGAV